MYYAEGRVTDYSGDRSKERFVLESTYDSRISGRRLLSIERENHEVGVSLTFEEHSPGANGKRGYTRQIYARLSRDALAELIEHLKRGLEGKEGKVTAQ